MHEVDRAWLGSRLELLGGPGYRGEQARDQAVAEMRVVGVERVFPLLRQMLTDPDASVRCQACEAILRIDPDQGVALVLPLLADSHIAVRWHACGCLHDFGDEQAVTPLSQVMARDPDTQVRGTAAYALGGIGSRAAIPELLATMATDHERDIHGHTPSSCAATALDDILGVRDQEPDLTRLRELAEAAYQEWLADRK